MNILIMIPDDINEKKLGEIGSAIVATFLNKPQKNLNIDNEKLDNRYNIIKRDGGAIDYTIKIKDKEGE